MKENRGAELEEGSGEEEVEGGGGRVITSIQ